MKSMTRWAVLFWFAMGTMFALLLGVDIYKGTAFDEAWPSAALWAAATAAIFTFAQYRKSKTMADCVVCDRLQGKS